MWTIGIPIVYQKPDKDLFLYKGLMMAPCSWNMLPWYICILTIIKWRVRLNYSRIYSDYRKLMERWLMMKCKVFEKKSLFFNEMLQSWHSFEWQRQVWRITVNKDYNSTEIRTICLPRACMYVTSFYFNLLSPSKIILTSRQCKNNAPHMD
jgi:hypothetical protein